MPVHGPMQKQYRLAILQAVLDAIREHVDPIDQDVEIEAALMHLRIADLVSEADAVTRVYDKQTEDLKRRMEHARQMMEAQSSGPESGHPMDQSSEVGGAHSEGFRDQGD